MNISLTPELERLVDEKVRSGNDMPRLPKSSARVCGCWKEREELKQQRLAEVRQKIDRGIEQLDQGFGIPGPEARARLRQRKGV